MSRSARDGISLIEVLVVVAIIAILIGMLLPATRRVGEAAARMKCSNNLKQLMLAMHTYSETTGKPVASASSGSPVTPAERPFPTGCFGPGSVPEERLSWMVALLPYLEQDNLYKQFDFEKGYTENLPAAQTRIKIFYCPGVDQPPTGDAVTHYVAMAGLGPDAALRPTGAVGNGFMGYDRLTSMAMITDGTSNTIALMETQSGIGPWARGGASTVRGFDPADVPFSRHEGGINAAMADGSVRFIDSKIEPQKLADAITIAGGEQIDLD